MKTLLPKVELPKQVIESLEAVIFRVNPNNASPDGNTVFVLIPFNASCYPKTEDEILGYWGVILRAQATKESRQKSICQSSQPTPVDYPPQTPPRPEKPSESRP